MKEGILIQKQFLWYPRCSTTRKAKTWLEENRIEFVDRDMIKNNPDEKELRNWHLKSGLPLKKFFNTGGRKYRELNLKDKLPEMSEAEMYKLLSTDGMLVKRPLLITEDKVLVGFKQTEWERELL